MIVPCLFFYFSLVNYHILADVKKSARRDKVEKHYNKDGRLRNGDTIKEEIFELNNTALLFAVGEGLSTRMYVLYVRSSHMARLRINRVRLPILLVVS